MGDSSKLWTVQNNHGQVLGNVRAMNETKARQRAEKLWRREGRLTVRLAHPQKAKDSGE
jgi:hypothetical protein